MRTFQLVHNGKRVDRLIVNYHAEVGDIAKACFVACISFSLSVRYGELDGEVYCGLKKYDKISPKTGSQLGGAGRRFLTRKGGPLMRLPILIL